jgi:hypothetical protein
LAIITALLRITEIAHSRRLAAFSPVALADLVREVGELYEPIAEDKRVIFTVGAQEDVVVRATVTFCSRPWPISSTMP